MTKEIMIVGAGGFGREVAWTLERINEDNGSPVWNILGFADDAPDKANGSLEGYPLLGGAEQASHDHPGAAVFIAIGDNAIREQIFGRMRGHDFPALVDPSADVAPTAELHQGAYIGPQAVVSVGAEIGRFAVVNARAGIGHDTKVGDFAQICPGATLSGHTTIGDHAFVASNASTAPGVTVGDRAKVAAGMPVYGDLAADATLSPFGIFRQGRESFLA